MTGASTPRLPDDPPPGKGRKALPPLVIALARSFYPILAIVVIAGAALFGPWGSLALAFVSIALVLAHS